MQCIGEVVGDDYLVLVYGYINGDGKLETGTTKFYRKKGKLPDPPKVWEVSLVVDSNVREEMKFTPQTEIIKRTFPAPSKGSSFSKNVTDNGVTEIEGNAEFCNHINSTVQLEDTDREKKEILSQESSSNAARLYWSM